MNITEDRKAWHNAEAQLSENTKCVYCGGPMEVTMVADPATDSIEYPLVCKNPDCPSKNY